MSKFPMCRYRSQNPIQGFEHVEWQDVHDAETVLARVSKCFDAEATPIYLYGPPGHGKSSLAALLTYGRPCGRFVRLHGYLQRLIDYRCGKTPKCPNDHQCNGVLVLDDLGSKPLSETTTELLLEILHDRARHGRDHDGESLWRPTVITGNFTWQELQAAGVDPRITSRLSGGGLIEMSSWDRRPEQAV